MAASGACTLSCPMQSNPITTTRTALGLDHHGGLATLAALLGVHRDTLGKWIRGEQRPPAVAVRSCEMLVVLHRAGLLAELKL